MHNGKITKTLLISQNVKPLNNLYSKLKMSAVASEIEPFLPQLKV